MQKLLDYIKSFNPNCEFIIGIGKQNFLSKIAKNITLNFDAHAGTISSHKEQLSIIRQKMKIIKSKKKYLLYDRYLLRKISLKHCDLIIKKFLYI